MSDTFIFNHHSLPFESTAGAEKAIPEFLKICIDASISVGLKTMLIDSSIDSSWFRVELSSGFFWKDWFDKNKKKDNFRDEIRAFRRIATHSPLFKPEDIGGDLELFDVREVNTDRNYSALRASVWYESPLCSFPTRVPWVNNPLDILIETLDAEGAIIKKDKKLTNISNLSDWNIIKPELVTRRNSNVSNGRELWKKRKDFFPFLQFCGKTSQQLQSWSHGKGIFAQVNEVLTCLNAYSVKMNAGVVKGYSHPQLKEMGLNFEVNGESLTVKQTPRLRKERLFYLPNGNSEFFENHTKLSKGFRIHFFPDPHNKIIHIGYIGPHLRLK